MPRPKKTPLTRATLAENPAGSARTNTDQHGRTRTGSPGITDLPLYHDITATPASSPSAFSLQPSASSIPPGVLTPAELSGIRCRKCGCSDLRVAYVRHFDGYTQRVRFCRHCGRRIVTRETEQ